MYSEADEMDLPTRDAELDEIREPTVSSVLPLDESETGSFVTATENPCRPTTDDESTSSPKPFVVDKIEDRECGLGKCRPEFMQSCASIKCFTFFCSVLVTVQGIQSGGYLPSVISTLERRYGLPSGLSSLIPSSYELGNLLTVVFVSYLGTRRHIPFWMGCGVILMAVGSFLFSLPHFLSGFYGDLSGSSHENFSDALHGTICRPTSPQPGIFQSISEYQQNKHHKKEKVLSDCTDGNSGNQSDSGVAGSYIWIFVIAQIMMGSGGSPIFTLGSAYIDDHVKKESSAMYLGIMYMMIALGPVLGIVFSATYASHMKKYFTGFLLGGSLLRLHVDFPAVREQNQQLDSSSANWVGAWWGGFVFCGIILASVAVTFFAFPKSISREKAKLRLGDKEDHFNDSFGSLADRSGDAAGDKEYGKSLKGMPRAVSRLFHNPVYFITCLGACMELFNVSGFVVFLPKYLETQFNVSRSNASVLIGGIAMPGACLGILTGGWLLKKFQMPLGAARLLVICNLICLSMFCILFTLGCDNIKIAGATTAYYSNPNALAEPFHVNLTNPCNMGCGCSFEGGFQPVCGADGLTYISPCHAGCTRITQDTGIVTLQANFSECSCIADTYSEGGVVVKPLATNGECPRTCGMLVPFIILTFVMTFTVSVAQMPILFLTMRTVAVEQRSLAIGLQFVFFRLLAYVPAPIAFGNLIDSSCLLWKSTGCASSGGCLLYDIEKFRRNYIGVGIGFKLAALVLFTIVYWLIRRKLGKRDLENDTLKQTKLTVGDVLTSSLISLNPPCVEHGYKCRGSRKCTFRNKRERFNSLPGDLESLSSLTKSEILKAYPV